MQIPANARPGTLIGRRSIFVVDHGVGRRQVQADATGLQADQEDGRLAAPADDRARPHWRTTGPLGMARNGARQLARDEAREQRQMNLLPVNLEAGILICSNERFS